MGEMGEERRAYRAHPWHGVAICPDAETKVCEIAQVYGREEAYEVIRRSQEDYAARFGAV